MQVPHPTFFLHNGFFRIATASLNSMATLDFSDTERHLTAAF